MFIMVKMLVRAALNRAKKLRVGNLFQAYCIKVKMLKRQKNLGFKNLLVQQ